MTESQCSLQQLPHNYFLAELSLEGPTSSQFFMKKQSREVYCIAYHSGLNFDTDDRDNSGQCGMIGENIVQQSIFNSLQLISSFIESLHIQRNTKFNVIQPTKFIICWL